MNSTKTLEEFLAAKKLPVRFDFQPVLAMIKLLGSSEYIAEGVSIYFLAENIAIFLCGRIDANPKR